MYKAFLFHYANTERFSKPEDIETKFGKLYHNSSPLSRLDRKFIKFSEMQMKIGIIPIC